MTLPINDIACCFSLLSGMTLLLSSDSGMYFDTHKLPLAGHVLIYGPSVSRILFFHYLIMFKVLAGNKSSSLQCEESANTCSLQHTALPS